MNCRGFLMNIKKIMKKNNKEINNNINKEEILPTTETIGYAPHAGQLRIHDAINNSNDKYYIICNGRQWG